MRVRVDIARRAGIADPEGTTIRHALAELGFEEVREVSVGRTIVVDLAADDAEAAEAEVRDMCERLLANPVIEDYEVSVEEVAAT